MTLFSLGWGQKPWATIAEVIIKVTFTFLSESQNLCSVTREVEGGGLEGGYGVIHSVFNSQVFLPILGGSPEGWGFLFIVIALCGTFARM